MFSQLALTHQSFNLIAPARAPMLVRFRVLVNGEPTPTTKVLRVCAGAGFGDRDTLVYRLVQEYSDDIVLYDRVWRGRATWLVIVEDMAATPPLYRGAVLEIQAPGTYTLNLETGSGGSAGDPVAVQATVKVNRVPASREVVAVERTPDGVWAIAGYGTSSDGELELALRVRDGRVYALSVDDYGIEYQPSIVVQVGQRVRPVLYSGWLYQVTESGVLPPSEPLWWAAEGDNVPRLLGTARAVAVRYYQPLAHGPVPVEIL